MNEPNDNSIDLELQVRLLNLVLGEASDFERDQLQQLMEQRPELVEYFQHLEHLHGLLSVVGGGQWQPDERESQADAPWTLPESKRQQLLAVLDGSQSPPESPKIFVVDKSSRWKVSSPWTATLLTVCASTILLGFLMWPAVEVARSVSTRLGAGSPVDSESAVAAVPSSGELYDAEAVAAYKGPSRRSEVHLNRMSESGAASAPADPSSIAESAGRPFSFRDASGGSGVNSGGYPLGQASPDDRKDFLAAGVEQTEVSGELLNRSDRNRSAGRGDVVQEMGADKRRNDTDDGMRSAASPGMGLGGIARSGGVAGRGGMAGGGMGGATDDAKPSGSADESVGQSVRDLSGGTRFEAVPDSEVVVDSHDSHSLQPPNEIVQELERAEAESFGASSATEQASRPQIAQMGRQAANETYFFEGRQSPSSLSPSPPNGTAAIEPPKLENVDWFADTPQNPSVNRVENLGKKIDSNFATNVPAFGGVVVQEQPTELGIPLRGTVPSIIAEGKESSQPSEEMHLGHSSSTASDPSSRGIETVTIDEKDTGVADLAPPREMDEQSASDQPFSTFSLHVSDVSFKLAQESLNQGQMPAAESIRIEEFVNALDYRDPLPSSNEKVACQVEQAIHPFLMQRNLLRVSMRTSAAGRSSSTPLRLTLLLDNSGSMERPDRRQIVQRGLQTLVQQLSDADQVTLVSFANTPRLLADKVSGSLGQTLLQIVENLPSEGGTNIEAALRLAGEKALEQKTAGAQNRIVLMTDGAVNLGDADPNRLARLITELRDLGVAFDAAGIGSQGLNDEVLEALTRRGDGRYYLLESVDSAGEDFSSQIAGALRPSARNVKVQVEFNPNRVGRYQLLGFESHRLKKEDFRNDSVDAAELSASEAGVAVYHFEVLPHGSGDVGNVSVRFQDLDTGEMVEQRWPILYQPSAPRLDAASPSLKMASAAALFAAKLQGGPLADVIDLEELHRMLLTLPQSEMNQPRAEQLRTMIQQAKDIL